MEPQFVVHITDQTIGIVLGFGLTAFLFFGVYKLLIAEMRSTNRQLGLEEEGDL